MGEPATTILACLITTAALAKLDTYPPQAFVRGKVLLADGQPPPEGVEIQLVCAGQARPQCKTDSQGRFRFEWGAPRFLEAVTIPSWPPPVSSTSDQRGYLKQMTCYLRGALKGYYRAAAVSAAAPAVNPCERAVI